MRIRSYLIVMALAILAPVVVSSAVALHMLEDAGRTAALQNLHETAQSVSLLVDRDLYSAEASLQVLAGAPALDAGDLSTFYQQARRAQRGDDGWIALIDEHGQQLLNTYLPYGAQLPPPKPPFAARAQQTLAAGTTNASGVFRGAVTGRMMATLDVPVYTHGGKRYLLTGAFTIEHFKRVFASARIPAGFTVGLLDGEGRFLARTGGADDMIGKLARPELIAAAAAAPSGMLRHQTWEGRESYDVYTHSLLSGWTVGVAVPVTTIDGAARRATWVAGLGMLAALLCAGGVALFFGGRHVRAIDAAAHEAINLGRGVAPPQSQSRVREVRELHAALHAAGVRLLTAGQDRARAEAERDELLQREQRARREAEQQNMAKDQFLAMLGHELRNPLAPISSAAHLLKMPGLDAARLNYASEVITRQVGHITRLVNDLLDVSRVTRGLVTLNATELDLRRIVADAVEQAESLVAAKQHHLELTLPPQPLWVRGDQTRLVQVLSNLLNNAAKYSPPHSRIEVTLASASASASAPEPEPSGSPSASPSPSSASASVLASTSPPAGQGAAVALLTVRDNGFGIEAGLLPRVFEPFSQGERTPDRAQGGLGLGLALVKSLVELHGGSVTAASAGDGQGSCFTLRLPLLAADPRSAAAPSVAPARADQGGLRVLLVDDNVDAADSLALLLSEAAGYDVTVCHDGARALELAATLAPQALILDIGLPDIDGYELARRLRRSPQTADALMMALTGYGQLEDRARAREAGFDYHLSKPADPQQILGLLALVPRQADGRASGARVRK
ncbi:ATP-binding protein [Rugamonas sp.]|uniref:hybrid sensor histidine kinase/response regulator n=1 Tax=Rugamonas sp. TaxID=1926287 RepID=UPI0025E7EC1D|nr:ATP-binding protein [Rugamonas sp.]